MGLVIRQSIWGAAFSYLGAGLGFVNNIFLFPRVMEADQFGLAKLLMSIAVLASTIGLLGVPSGIVKFLPGVKDKGERGSLTTGMVSLATLGMFITCVVLFILKGVLSQDSSSQGDMGLADVYSLVIIATILSGWSLTMTSFARANLKASTPIFLKEFLERLLHLGLLLIYSYGGMDFLEFLQWYVFTTGTTGLVVTIYLLVQGDLTFSFRPQNLALPWKSILIYCLVVFLGGTGSVVVSSIDSVMIYRLLGDVNEAIGLESVAVYVVMVYVSTLILLPSRAIVGITLPLVSKYWREKKVDEIDKIYRDVCLGQTTLALVIFAGILVNTDLLFHLLEPGYEVGYWALVFLGASKVAEMATGLNTAILQVSDHYRWSTWVVLFLAGLVVLTNFIFIPLMGITGAALATAISYTLFTLVKYVLVWRFYGFNPLGSWRYMKLLLVFGLALCAALFLPELSNIWVDAIMKSSVLLILFITVTWIWVLDSSERSKLIELTKRKTA